MVAYVNDISEHGMKRQIKKESDQSIVALASSYEEKRFKNGDIKANTYVRLKQTIKTIGTFKFANIPIKKVTRNQIEFFLQEERTKAESTLKKEFRLLKKVFTLAYNKKLVKENFFDGCAPITKPSSFQVAKKVEAFSRKEEFILQNYMNRHYSKYKDIIFLALYTRYANRRNSSFIT